MLEYLVMRQTVFLYKMEGNKLNSLSIWVEESLNGAVVWKKDTEILIQNFLETCLQAKVSTFPIFFVFLAWRWLTNKSSDGSIKIQQK